MSVTELLGENPHRSDEGSGNRNQFGPFRAFHLKGTFTEEHNQSLKNLAEGVRVNPVSLDYTCIILARLGMDTAT